MAQRTQRVRVTIPQSLAILQQYKTITKQQVCHIKTSISKLAHARALSCLRAQHQTSIQQQGHKDILCAGGFLQPSYHHLKFTRG